MIDRIKLKNFKRFADLDLELSALTLLTGLNSGGKSSILQALALLHADRLPSGAVPLNGPYGLALGEASDVLNSQASTSEIVIAIASGNERGVLDLEVPDDRSSSLIALREEIPDGLGSLNGLERGFVYLSAERLGPLDLQEVAADFDAELAVGSRGEFTAHVLSQLGRSSVPETCLHPDTDTEAGVVTLKAQAELWMSTIVGPIQIEATWITATNAAMVRFKPPDVLTEWLRPANVGFGVSYALPVVVAGLSAPEGGLFIVENPEAHLHPSGQSAIGNFLARVAAGGTQVLVETHSDHVLDGVRRGVAAERVIAPDHLTVHYFGRDADVITLSIDDTGSMSAWPRGFFDQTETDLAELARAKRNS